ncbi:hypothetical protein JW905_14500, partial [bacterium]|nr:hypothetical protein [candidate division CSSED10-310 bacterium]
MRTATTLLILVLFGLWNGLVPAQAVPPETEFLVNTTMLNSQNRSDLALNAAGGFVAVWTSRHSDDGDILGQLFTADGLKMGTEFTVNNVTIGRQDSARVVMTPSGAFIVTWAGQDSYSWGVMARLFNADGSPAGAEFQVNESGAGTQDHPIIALAVDGDFIIRWTDWSLSKMFAQRYQSDGTAIGGNMELAVSVIGYGGIHLDAAKNFVTGWARDNTVYMRSFAWDGTPISTETVVGAASGGPMAMIENCDIAMDDSSRVFITWDSIDMDMPPFAADIYARIMNMDGLPVTGVFQVNTTLSEFQTDPAVDCTSGGGFMVAWTNNDQSRIYAQRFDGSGNAVGSEQSMNTLSAASYYPLPRIVDDSRFLLTWTMDGIDGSNEGVVCRGGMAFTPVPVQTPLPTINAFHIPSSAEACAYDATMRTAVAPVNP